MKLLEGLVKDTWKISWLELSVSLSGISLNNTNVWEILSRFLCDLNLFDSKKKEEIDKQRVSQQNAVQQIKLNLFLNQGDSFSEEENHPHDIK